MRTVNERAVIAAPVELVYERLADFASYPGLAPSVLHVRVVDTPDDAAGRRRCLSSWEVTFRDGILRWTELDVFDVEQRTIAFEQTEGDIEIFRGAWIVTPHAGGSEVRFEAELDLGLPGLADFLEPVAKKALEENVRELLTRLFATHGVTLPGAVP
jgi:ribosome-associated toxin RatA of RatAB toxin-antitoxin module